MFTKIDVTSSQGVMLSLPLQDLSSGYLIQSIDGLDPVKATIVTSSMATMDGSQYQSSRRESRNLVMKLELQPDYGAGTVRELRARLYSVLMPESQITMRFYADDMETVEIAGIVESFDYPMFVKDPVVTISLMCFIPDFYSLNTTTINGNTTSGTSEFLVDYDGTVDTGIAFQINVNRTLSNFTIYHRPPDNTIRSLAFTSSLSAGDVLKINTVSGAKGATLIRGGSEQSLLYGITPYSNWINLAPGPNYMRIYASGAAVPYTFSYTTKYGGL